MKIKLKARGPKKHRAFHNLKATVSFSPLDFSFIVFNASFSRFLHFNHKLYFYHTSLPKVEREERKPSRKFDEREDLTGQISIIKNFNFSVYKYQFKKRT